MFQGSSRCLFWESHETYKTSVGKVHSICNIKAGRSYNYHCDLNGKIKYKHQRQEQEQLRELTKNSNNM
jgi:hypothetical protein